MISEEQKHKNSETRLRRIQELGQAHQYLNALVNQDGTFSPELFTFKQQVQALQARTFDLGDHGRLEIRSFPWAVPSPLAFWDETTVVVLLWDRALSLVLRRRETLADAAAQAGLALSRAETSRSPQPLLIYLVLAVLTLTSALPTPTQLQAVREVAD